MPNPRAVRPEGSTKRPKTLDREERRDLLDAPSNTTTTGIRARAILALMAINGLRISEVCKLKVRDLRLGSNHPYLRVIEGKGKKDRRAWLSPKTAELLDYWLEMRPKGTQNLWPALRPSPSAFGGKKDTKKGQPIGARTVYGMVRRYAEKAGISWQIHPHTLRHTTATLALDAGMTVREVQEMMGHADGATTLGYTHVTGRQMSDAMRKLEEGEE